MLQNESGCDRINVYVNITDFNYIDIDKIVIRGIITSGG